MRTRRIVMATALFLLAIVSAYLFLPDAPEISSLSSKPEATSPTLTVEPLFTEDRNAAERPITSAKLKARGQEVKLSSHAAGLALFQQSEKAERELRASANLPVDLNGEAYVEIDLDKIRSLQLGERFTLNIPQLGHDIEAEVDYITEHKNGDRTVEAFFPGHDQRFAAVITTGNESSYGQINTPNGLYLMQAQGGNAWIASKADLVQSHVPHDDGVPIPEQPNSAPTQQVDADITIVPLDELGG